MARHELWDEMRSTISLGQVVSRDRVVFGRVELDRSLWLELASHFRIFREALTKTILLDKEKTI